MLGLTVSLILEHDFLRFYRNGVMAKIENDTWD